MDPRKKSSQKKATKKRVSSKQNPQNQNPQPSQPQFPPTQFTQNSSYYPYQTHPNLPIKFAPGQFRMPTEHHVPHFPMFDAYAIRSPQLHQDSHIESSEEDDDDQDYEDEETPSEVQETQPFVNEETPIEDEPIEEPQRRTLPNRANPRKWLQSEEVALARAWFHCSEDKKDADQQRRASFWRKVLGDFRTRIGNPSARTIHQVTGKWRDMENWLKKWHGIFSQMKRQWGSGRSDVDILNMSKEDYKNTYSKPFNLEHVYEVVKTHPKYMEIPSSADFNAETQMPKRSRTSESGEYRSGSNSPFIPDLNEDSTPTRKGKEKVGTSSASKGKFVDILDNLASTRDQERRERFELMEAMRQSRISLEEEQRNAAREIASYHSTQREIARETQKQADIDFFIRDHSHLTGYNLQIILDRKREIARKYGWQFDD